MANITKRTLASGEVKYQALVRLKGTASQTATFERKTDAKEWASRIESDIRAGRYFPSAIAKSKTVGNAIERYISEVLPHKSASTIRDQTQQLGWWGLQVGKLAMSELSTSVVSKYKAQLASEAIPSQSKKPQVGIPPRYRSNSTINAYLAVLSHLCTVAAKEWQWIERNPLENVRKQQLNNARIRFLSESEREHLLSECQKFPNLHLVVLLSLTTGARKNEIWHLKWDQVNLERKTIILTLTKNKQVRPLPIVDQLIPMLRELKKGQQIQESGYLFQGLKQGKPFDFSRQWSACLLAAGVHDFRYHDLRHTAASYLAMSGATLAEISEILGHKTLQMVKRYSHFTDGHTSKVVERMASRFF